MFNDTHRVPSHYLDYVALALCKAFRCLADMIFRKRHGHRALVIETVAAIPGVVSGVFVHLKCLRKAWGDQGRIQVLQSEAENERMHFLVFAQIVPLRFPEKLMIYTAQAGFFTFFFLLYMISPYTGHRMVGYFEEEAIYSYREYLQAIDDMQIPNSEAPSLAIEYWSLSSDARLRDVIEAIIQDEIHHRDSNHHFADVPLSDIIV
jgi:ubiquinol oxidase